MNDAAHSISFGEPRRRTTKSLGRNTNSLSVPGGIAYFGALAALLVFAIPHGTVEPWQKGVLIVVIAIVGVLRVTDGILSRVYSIAETRMLMPMVGIVVVAGFQVMPLPSGGTLSADPYQTRSFILVFAALVVFGELLFFYVRNDRRLTELVLGVLVVVISSSMLGVIRNFFSGTDLDVFATNLQTEQSYAQFINRNHFALLVEMGLGLLVGILLRAQLRVALRVLGWIAAAFLVYSMIVANSRGGLLSLSGMAFFTVFVFVTTRSRNDKRRSSKAATSQVFRTFATAIGLCLISFLIIVALVVFIGGDSVVTRLEVIDREFVAEETRVNRAAIWESTIEMVKERPLFGSGFGAYATAITKFDPTNGRFYLQQAHNDYLEILANGGIVAALLFAAFGALAGSRLVRNLRSSNRFRQACCFGALIGIFGVLIHSFVDFGLHVMVNALVFIALIVIGTANIDPEAEPR